ncbi:hypothetical protein [Lottiidibacillus patelloidae]
MLVKLKSSDPPLNKLSIAAVTIIEMNVNSTAFFHLLEEIIAQVF